MILPKRLRVLIADDEFYARQRIAQLLEGEPGLKIVAECCNGVEAVDRIRELDPDVLFLDIQMPELDGFGVLEAIGPGHMPSTVFTTAFNQHAIQAFEVNAVDYLLKPIDPERMAKAIARVQAWHQVSRTSDIQAQLEGLLDMVRHEGSHLTRIMVKQEDHHVIVKVRDIQWVEGEDNYVRLHVEGTSHLLRTSMSNLLARLDPGLFRRIHRSSIVNMDYIREVRPWFSGEHIVVMKDGTRLTMSRSYRDQFKELAQ
jgi:two-component system LytT family response regulator